MRSGFPDPTAVVVFCGGHGAQSLADALLDDPRVHLSLVVNGYDNGLSTGALRAVLPGMLGVSDFRKNLVPGLHDDDPHDHALRAVLEYRLPADLTEGPAAVAGLVADLRAGYAVGRLPWAPVEDLTTTERTTLAASLVRFETHRRATRAPFDYADCAVANLVMAGLYLREGRDFNRALEAYTDLFGARAEVHNVTAGENAWLVALKDDGELLVDEADIVAPQSAARIREVALLPDPVDPDSPDLAGLDSDERADWLHDHEVHPALDPGTAAALAAADLVVYAAGTQHSSLLPSYHTAGLADCLARSPARAAVLLVNIAHDHDIDDWDAVDVLDAALTALGDPDNERGSVTHVLYHDGRPSAATLPVPEWVRRVDHPRNCTWIGADLEDGVHSGVHHGVRTAAALAAILAAASGAATEDEIEDELEDEV